MSYTPRSAPSPRSTTPSRINALANDFSGSSISIPSPTDFRGRSTSPGRAYNNSTSTTPLRSASPGRATSLANSYGGSPSYRSPTGVRTESTVSKGQAPSPESYIRATAASIRAFSPPAVAYTPTPPAQVAAESPRTELAPLSSWLAPHLLKGGFDLAQVVLCEQKLVVEQGIATAKIMALYPPQDFSADYLAHLGITTKGVQLQLLALHRQVYAQYTLPPPPPAPVWDPSIPHPAVQEKLDNMQQTIYSQNRVLKAQDKKIELLLSKLEEQNIKIASLLNLTDSRNENISFLNSTLGMHALKMDALRAASERQQSTIETHTEKLQRIQRVVNSKY